MAKLSARGRTELARLTRDRKIEDDNLIDRERVTLAFMSDGHVLRKRDVWFKPEPGMTDYTLKHLRSPGSWKQWRRWAGNHEVIVRKFVERGYTRE